MDASGHKALFWVGGSRRDLQAFPSAVRQEMGYALYQAQKGGKHILAKPLRGFGGSAVLEVVSDFSGNTFRAVYTVRFREAVYVLHAFQKKSLKGRATPQPDLDLIRGRLRQAEEAHAAFLKEEARR